MSKKQKCPEFENHERWLVSYADMLTLLFAVFVVLFALKEGGEPQVQQTAGSMQESFNTPLEDIPVDRRVGPTEQGFGIFEHFRGEQIRPPLIQKYPSSKERIRIIDDEMKKLKVELEERLYGNEKFRETEAKGQDRIVSVERTPKGFKVQLLARYFFDPGEVKIKNQALPEMDRVIDMLKTLGRTVTVEGHTDSIPPPGPLTNWDISCLRASHVVRRMQHDHKYPQTKMRIAGYGDTRPIAHNGTEDGRRLNNRIEFQVDYDEDTPDPINE